MLLEIYSFYYVEYIITCLALLQEWYLQASLNLLLFHLNAYYHSQKP